MTSEHGLLDNSVRVVQNLRSLSDASNPPWSMNGPVVTLRGLQSNAMDRTNGQADRQTKREITLRARRKHCCRTTGCRQRSRRLPCSPPVPPPPALEQRQREPRRMTVRAVKEREWLHRGKEICCRAAAVWDSGAEHFLFSLAPRSGFDSFPGLDFCPCFHLCHRSSSCGAFCFCCSGGCNRDHPGHSCSAVRKNASQKQS